MECREYGLLVSRYVDDDLDGPEAEELLRHLSGCPECQSELSAVERLRGWLRAADLPPAVLEMLDRTTLVDRVESWEAPAPSFAPAVSRPRRQWGAAIASLWQRPLDAIGRFTFGPASLRFALPLLLLGIGAGLWLARSPGAGKTVDVRQLPSAVALQTPLVEGDREPDGLYVLEHVSQQPWVRYGDELPMIQLVSEGTR